MCSVKVPGLATWSCAYNRFLEVSTLIMSSIKFYYAVYKALLLMRSLDVINKRIIPDKMKIEGME